MADYMKLMTLELDARVVAKGGKSLFGDWQVGSRIGVPQRELDIPQWVRAHTAKPGRLLARSMGLLDGAIAMRDFDEGT